MTVAAQGEGPARAVLLSPFRRSAWYATAAIALGLLVGVIAAGVVYSAISSGLSTLLFGFGLVFIALGIEASRVFAAIERRRIYLGQPAHPPAHPYRPLRGSFVDLLRAEFTDPNRWRDVLYVAVNLPLSLIEFIVVLTVWALSAGLITIGIWYPVYVGSPLPQMLVLVALG